VTVSSVGSFLVRFAPPFSRLRAQRQPETGWTSMAPKKRKDAVPPLPRGPPRPRERVQLEDDACFSATLENSKDFTKLLKSLSFADVRFEQTCGLILFSIALLPWDRRVSKFQLKIRKPSKDTRTFLQNTFPSLSFVQKTNKTKMFTFRYIWQRFWSVSTSLERHQRHSGMHWAEWENNMITEHEQ
jgi:hypothetical protein